MGALDLAREAQGRRASSEAPRGALAHWMHIKDGKIENYQLVVPSTWNASPRDAAGRRSAYEASLLGTPVPTRSSRSRSCGRSTRSIRVSRAQCTSTRNRARIAGEISPGRHASVTRFQTGLRRGAAGALVPLDQRAVRHRARRDRLFHRASAAHERGEASSGYWLGNCASPTSSRPMCFFNFLFRLYWAGVGNKYTHWRNFLHRSRSASCAKCGPCSRWTSSNRATNRCTLSANWWPTSSLTSRPARFPGDQRLRALCADDRFLAPALFDWVVPLFGSEQNRASSTMTSGSSGVHPDPCLSGFLS